MRLLINTTSTFKGGGVQVAASFLRECERRRDHEFGVILGPGLSPFVREEDFSGSFRFFQLNYRPAQRVLSLRRTAKDLERIESAFRPDVVFTTSGPSYWRPRAPHLMGFNLPHHLYPDSPYFTQVLNPIERIRWRAKSLVIHHYTKGFADAWAVQTDDVNQRLRQWISCEQVYTVPNTISRVFLDAQGTDEVGPRTEGEGSSCFRVLVLSSYYRHKNLEIINNIIDMMRKRGIQDLRFTMTLPAQDFEETILPENRALIDNVGPQSPEACPALYQQSDVLFLPTLLECFSANYVEAMAMQRPIITTDLGFARTVCANAALYFEPLNADHALEKILKLRAEASLYRDLVKAGQVVLPRFGTPRERAEAYLSLCRKLAGEKPQQKQVI